jgi:hypothetical protein
VITPAAAADTLTNAGFIKKTVMGVIESSSEHQKEGMEISIKH